MTKAEMIDKMVKKHSHELTKKLAGELMNEMFELMAKTIKKEKKFSYPGFGTFMLRTRKARNGRNPQTGETIRIKASKTVGFRPAKGLKDRL